MKIKILSIDKGDSMKKITYVTGNWAKVESAKKALEPLGYEIDNIKMETPEIQADDVNEVAAYSAKWAANELNRPVLKNDSGLFVKSLKGFPGVYTHYAEDTIGEDGLLKLMEGIKDREAYFKEALAYCVPGEEPVIFESITKGTIDIKKTGTYGWSWDFVFIPDGENKSLACFPDDERWNFWSQDAYRKLAEYIEKH
jgi:XTP/dITP diphosphohydrolase